MRTAASRIVLLDQADLVGGAIVGQVFAAGLESRGIGGSGFGHLGGFLSRRRWRNQEPILHVRRGDGEPVVGGPEAFEDITEHLASVDDAVRVGLDQDRQAPPRSAQHPGGLRSPELQRWAGGARHQHVVAWVAKRS